MTYAEIEEELLRYGLPEAFTALRRAVWCDRVSVSLESIEKEQRAFAVAVTARIEQPGKLTPDLILNDRYAAVSWAIGQKLLKGRITKQRQLDVDSNDVVKVCGCSNKSCAHVVVVDGMRIVDVE